MEKERISRLVVEVSDYAKKLRNQFHMNPELSDQEVETQKRICKELDLMGIEYSTYEDMNGVIGIIKGGKPGKTIAFRADMDLYPFSKRMKYLINLKMMEPCMPVDTMYIWRFCWVQPRCSLA